MTCRSISERDNTGYILNPMQHSALLRAFEGRMVQNRYGRSRPFEIFYDSPDTVLTERSMKRRVSGKDKEINLERRRIALTCMETLELLGPKGNRKTMALPETDMERIVRTYSSTDGSDLQVKLEYMISKPCVSMAPVQGMYPREIIPNGYYVMAIETSEVIPAWLESVMSELGIWKPRPSEHVNPHKQTTPGKNKCGSVRLRYALPNTPRKKEGERPEI